MPSSTELQQALALRKANPQLSVRDAVLQVAKPPAPIANAPVAWQAPAITPIAPTPTPVAPLSTNQQVLADNKAKVAWEIQAWTRPEVWQQATPEQVPQIVQQVQKPVEPVAPVTSTEVKAETPATTPTPVKPTTPAVIPPTDKKGILSALTTWQPVAPQNTPEYRKATAVHTAFQKFNGMSEQQLLDNIKQGQITTEMWGLLAQNPSYQLARKKADELASSEATNNTIQGIKNGMTGKAMTTPNYLEDISNELIKKFWLVDQSSQEAFKTIVSEDPEVVSYTKQLHDINRQVAETTEMLNKGYAEMKANYWDLTQSQIMNYMSSSFKWANDLLSTLNNTKSYLEADLKNATDMAVAEYGAKQEDIAQMNQMRNVVFWQAVQSQFALASKLQEQSLADELAVQAQNAPEKAIPILIDQYTKLGVPMQRSVQEMIAEAQNEIANGWTLASYLTKLQQTIQSKPEYKRIQEMKAWELSDVEKMKLQAQLWEASNVADFNRQISLASAKWDIDRQNYLWQIQNDPEKQAKALEIQEKLNNNKSLFDVLGTNVGTYEGNRGYDLAWQKWTPVVSGNGWKVISTDTAWEQVWSIFKSGKWAKPYGNTVVMEDENGNQVRYSHLDSIWVKEWDVLGFWDIIGAMGNTGNVLWKNWEKLTAEQLSQGRGSHVDVEIKDPSGRLLSNAEQVDYLKNQKKTPSLWKEELKAISTARTNLEQDPQYKAYRTLANQISDVKWIQSRINNWTATPQDQQQMITAFSKVLDPTSVVRESEFELTKKYGQAWYQALLQNVSQYWRGDWILNPESAKILAESLANRYGSIEQEYNNQLQLAKDNIELNLWRKLTNKEFETLTQTKFSWNDTKATPTKWLTGVDLVNEWENFKPQ